MTRPAFDRNLRMALEECLPIRLPGFRWFGGKSRTIQRTRILDLVPIDDSMIAIVKIEYADGKPDVYTLPLKIVSKSEFLGHKSAAQVDLGSVILEFQNSHRAQSATQLVIEGTSDPHFRSELLNLTFSGLTVKSRAGRIQGSITRKLRKRSPSTQHPHWRSRVLNAEQSNTSIIFGDRYILKFFRRFETGLNPDVEIGQFLANKTKFKNSPAALATLQYKKGSGNAGTLASVHEFIANEGDAWSLFLELGRKHFRKLAKLEAHPPIPERQRSDSDLTTEIPSAIKRRFGKFLSLAELLGRRTFEMHEALGSGLSASTDPNFSPEPMTAAQQRGLYRTLKGHADLTFHILGQNLPKLSSPVRRDATKLLELREAVYWRLSPLLSGRLPDNRVRTHGDYHLGQVLFTGSDFIIIDFEGEPARPLTERRKKRSALRDVAGMLRSFHYASRVLTQELGSGSKTWSREMRIWHSWVTAAYLNGYFARTQEAAFLPKDPKLTRQILDLYLIEKALYELVYEINNRPHWVNVPLAGILELLSESPGLAGRSGLTNANLKATA